MARLGVLAVTSVIAALIVLVSGDASAAPSSRRRFDPDDLQFDPPGELHMDLALGAMRGDRGRRWLAPDFDIDFAIASNVILGLDGAFIADIDPQSPYSLTRYRSDVLWVNSKFGVYDSKDEVADTAWAAGVQLGPRFPNGVEFHGAGFQAVGLLGRRLQRTSTVLNVGGMIDSGDAIASGRPIGVLAGIDVTTSFGDHQILSLMGDLSAGFFFSGPHNQLSTTFGPVVAVAPWLDVSVNALVGFLAGGDHLGAFIQFTPKLAVF